ncbi:mechanosensitive ion channel protein MscL [Candidatus Woesearchaeota archaeon CG10_big_fil_rev_8_21_14_0_10_34_8]|nr:MAG: mechanosensitive ion channel protein MscL [Candidatus Woesearchaeota archaeon CG10_big_fil_rev_8_21_14_0_10_34_8]
MVDITQILSMTFFDNTILSYLIFFGIIAVSIIGGRILYYIAENIIMALTKKTETVLDDMLLEVCKHPVVFLIFIVGFYIAYHTLTLTVAVEETFFNTVLVLFIVNLTWFFTRLLDGIIKYYVGPWAKTTHTDLDDTLLPILRKLGKVFLVLIAAIIVLDKFGYNVASLVAGLGIGGLAVALAAQETLSNMFGGITIISDKPFKLGDRIKISGNDGFVKEIGIRSSKMKTLDGSELIIPNSTIAKEIIENVTREEARRIKFTVGVVYDTSTKKLEKAISIIKDIVKKHNSTKDEAFVYFDAFADSSLSITAIYWIKDLDKIFDTKSEINFEIKKQFEKEKLEFAFPTRTIYNKKG